MALWYPASGNTWGQYLQASSFVNEITKEISLSEKALASQASNEMMKIVASNVELSRSFGQDLEGVIFAIDQLNAAFNYNMGLLVEQFQIQNELTEDLLDKLDKIHKAIEAPLLTQAREFYRIGCDRVNKKLLDKGLDAFLKAEKKNDTDFFIQYHIGMLYLYGIDEDDNLINLKKAKEHLVKAARFAKAEVMVDPAFSQYAAESLLHASIANYAQLEDFYKQGNKKKIAALLSESKKFATEAVELYPQLLEARYHLAKYEALLSEGPEAIKNLQTIVEQDRNYALKIQDDKSFDNFHSEIFEMLNELRTKAKNRFERVFNQAELSLKKLSEWKPEESTTLSFDYNECKRLLNLSKEHSEHDTYFGYLDAICAAEKAIKLSKELTGKRFEELKDNLEKILQGISFENTNESNEADKLYGDVKKLLEEAKTHLSELKSNYSSSAFYNALSLAQEAKDIAENANKLAQTAHNQRINKEKIEKNKAYWADETIRLVTTYGLVGALVGLVGGCIANLEGSAIGAFSGATLGAGAGALLGWIIGRADTPKELK